jgi:hypothetical protein
MWLPSTIVLRIARDTRNKRQIVSSNAFSQNSAHNQAEIAYVGRQTQHDSTTSAQRRTKDAKNNFARNRKRSKKGLRNCDRKCLLS